MKPASWIVPVVAAAGLAVVGLASVPFERIGWKPLDPPPAPPPVNPRPHLPDSSKNTPQSPKKGTSDSSVLAEREPPSASNWRPGDSKLLDRFNTPSNESSKNSPSGLGPSGDVGSTSGLLSSEITLYRSHMNFLKGSSAINAKASKEEQEAGALGNAAVYMEKAQRDLAIVSCLQNQLDLGVPFYQGKSTCVVAVQ
jgi:hypothetical protein